VPNAKDAVKEPIKTFWTALSRLAHSLIYAVAIAQLAQNRLNKSENIVFLAPAKKAMKSPNVTSKTAPYTITVTDTALGCSFLLENSHYNCGFSGKLHPRRP